jgi:hypothetical protein
LKERRLAPWLRSGWRRKLSERLQLDQQHESARLHHRGAFAHPLVCFVATVLLKDLVELGLKARINTAVDPVAIADQVARRFIPRECFCDLRLKTIN